MQIDCFTVFARQRHHRIEHIGIRCGRRGCRGSGFQIDIAPVRGAPPALVTSGGGSGIALYRALQRHGIPFAAGVLHENDMDFPVARALACEIVSEQPYQPIGDATQSRARALMHACRCVYAPLRTFGPMNEGNRLLIAEAAENGWLVSAISPKKPDAT